MDGLIPEERRIGDIDEWLRTNGLGAPSPVTTIDQEEEIARERAFAEYEKSIHRKFFAERDQVEKLEREARQRTIDGWKDLTIDIHTRDVPIRGVTLQPLAASCDTVFALASTWNLFSSSEEDRDKMYVTLDRFPSASVRDFLSLVNATNQAQSLSSESIVDCCEIAHYLQNATVLQETVAILQDSIDSSNCLSMCQLADQLNLADLFEHALAAVIQSLGDVEEGQEAWDLLTPDLRERILVIKDAIQSSVHTRTSRVFFASLDEYISIFAERVQYYRERLAEAKEQLGQIDVGSPAWEYTNNLIDRQASRVRTLETVLAEQKKVFAGKHMLRSRDY